jgi:putative transcriptional regulator
MNKVPYSKLGPGTMLLAGPEVSDEIYKRGVIVLCEHSIAAGSFGVMINKPLNIDLPEESLQIPNLHHPKISILCGGEMQPNQMMIMHTSNKHTSQTLKITEDVYLGGDLQFLQDSLNDEECSKIYLCFGYIGWLATELEREFMRGKWLIYPGSKEIIFDTPRDQLWQTILKKMGGKYAGIASIPTDLSLN